MSELCPNCGSQMERRRHEKITAKQLAKLYYFTEWDYCPGCKYIKHYEKFKVKNCN